MKLSQIEGETEAVKKAGDLRIERQTLGELLHYISGGSEIEMTTPESGYYASIRTAARPHAVAALEQSLHIVEQDLRDLGIEIDEPAFVPDDGGEGTVGEDDDEEAA